MRFGCNLVAQSDHKGLDSLPQEVFNSARTAGVRTWAGPVPQRQRHLLPCTKSAAISSFRLPRLLFNIDTFSKNLSLRTKYPLISSLSGQTVAISDDGSILHVHDAISIGCGFRIVGDHEDGLPGAMVQIAQNL